MPLMAVRRHNHSSQARIVESDGGGGRAVQEVQGCSAGAQPSTIIKPI